MWDQEPSRLRQAALLVRKENYMNSRGGDNIPWFELTDLEESKSSMLMRVQKESINYGQAAGTVNLKDSDSKSESCRTARSITGCH